MEQYKDIEDKQKELVEKFAELFSNLKQNLFNVKVTDVANYLCTLTNDDFIPELRNATTFDEIFALTSPFISFNQYSLLVYLVEQFGRSDVKAELQEYIEEVKEFNQKVTVGQLMEVMEKQQKKCRDEGREVLRRVDPATIMMEFDVNYKGKTLEQLHLDISTIFECEDYVLTLAEANLSTLQLTWYTAKSAVEHLTQKATERKSLMDDIGILALKVGPDIIIEEFSSSESNTTSSSLFDTIWKATYNGNVDQVHISLDLPEDSLQTTLRQTDNQNTSLLHFAVKCNQLEIVKVILSAIDRCSMKKLIWVSDANDMTPLELAVDAENLDIFKTILTYPTSVIIPPNYTNLLPLALSNLNNNAERSIEMAKLILNHSKGNPLILYPTFPQLFPELNVPTTALEHTIPVVVVGDSGAGKSTLIKSLQIQGLRSQLWHLFFKVQNVDDHKAGIIPTVFDSIWFGNVVFYDLSSHREFVHEAILHLRDAVFIVVVNLYNEIDEIAKQIVYWLSFIRYHHERARGQTTPRPNVIIVGSNLYKTKFGRLGHVERFYHYAYPKARSHIDTDQFNIVAKVLMDCRNSSLSNVILRQYLSSTFQRLRIHRPQLPTKCYLLYAFIKRICQPKNKGAVQVIDLLAELCSDHLHCKMFNNSVDEVLELCHPLSELNLLVVLEDKREKERSWIIFNSHPLLLIVEEVLFDTQHHGSDGILSRYEIDGLFRNLPISKRVDPDLILQLMIHYRYCIGVHDHRVPVSSFHEVKEDHFFFPHLLPEASEFPPNHQMMFAWSFSVERYHYFMPHFIHHFLLDLSQDPEVSEGEQCNRARRTLMTSFPLVGLELVVHIHSNQTILVSMKSCDTSDKGKIMCMVKRNHLISKITKIIEFIDPNMKRNVSPVEALIPISGDNAQYYPVVKPPKCQLLLRSVDLQYSTEKIKQAIINQSQVQPIHSAQPLSSVENLLSFEPYFYMDDELRRTLLYPPHPNETINFDFFESIGLALQLEKLCLLLAAIGINTAVIESLKNDSTRSFSEKLNEAYQHVFGKGVTYKELHQCLDSISFFKLHELVSTAS